jgi:hypothetical protein
MSMFQVERNNLPEAGAVFYRRLVEPFVPDRQHVFELAIYAEKAPVSGEIRLIRRLQARFGKQNVGIIRTDAATLVLRIVSEPLARDCAKWHISVLIATIVLQHYGWHFPVDIRAADGSVCGTRASGYQPD